MSEQTGKTGLKFKFHRPKDSLDVGFTIEGHTLKWVHSRQTEDKFGRPWIILRKSAVGDRVLEEFKRNYLDIFSGGDTIRRGDLVLAFAPKDRINEQRKELNKLASDALARIKQAPNAHGAIAIDQKETSVSRMSEAQVNAEFFNKQ